MLFVDDLALESQLLVFELLVDPVLRLIDLGQILLVLEDGCKLPSLDDLLVSQVVPVHQL